MRIEALPAIRFARAGTRAADGAAFHRSYLHATRQAFLEAHEHAFDYFGGVFHVLRYDNLTSAVRKILRGRRREETVRFMAFRSHWRFAAEFCTPRNRLSGLKYPSRTAGSGNSAYLASSID